MTSRISPKVTEDDLREAMANCALIMEQESWGDKLWPIFERLERELEAMRSKTDRLAAARAFSRESKHRTEARS
ncbi:hypothetical protein ASD00_36180 [Ensifer sp. Root31]|uniref:hypothetical protein n=1 Tax=Ensifer sp. Root31 TaxID=1736512 RepID=UPI00070D9CE3|nr:hypothetical protein [Ensifer sp. Root31]KQU79845.1 hypothetical protein ASD00_36180 [Ensifer sp. Root31]